MNNDIEIGLMFHPLIVLDLRKGIELQLFIES